jgi:hypothetical protein
MYVQRRRQHHYCRTDIRQHRHHPKDILKQCISKNMRWIQKSRRYWPL